MPLHRLTVLLREALYEPEPHHHFFITGKNRSSIGLEPAANGIYGSFVNLAKRSRPIDGLEKFQKQRLLILLPAVCPWKPPPGLWWRVRAQIVPSSQQSAVLHRTKFTAHGYVRTTWSG